MKTFSPIKTLRKRRFWRDRSGMAATEFGMIAPMMVFLLFALIETSDALTAGRRLTLAANTLADLVAQDSQLTHADVDGLFTGMEQIANVDDASSTFRVVSLVYDADDDRIEVDWSRDDNAGTPYAEGSVYDGLADPTLLDDTTSVIVAEATHDYAPSLTKIVIDSINMERHAVRWPRRTPKVQLCATEAACS